MKIDAKFSRMLMEKFNRPVELVDGFLKSSGREGRLLGDSQYFGMVGMAKLATESMTEADDTFADRDQF